MLPNSILNQAVIHLKTTKKDAWACKNQDYSTFAQIFFKKKEKLAVKINGKAQQNKYKEISKKPS